MTTTYDSEKIVWVGFIGGMITVVPCGLALAYGILGGHWHLALLAGYIIGNFMGCEAAAVAILRYYGK